jgi:hypothetical protein
MNGAAGRLIVLMVLASLLMRAGPPLDAPADEHFRLLRSKQIRSALVGHDIGDGLHWSLHLQPDGSVIGDDWGRSWKGGWRLEANRICLSKPSAADFGCYDVWMRGDTVSLRTARTTQSPEPIEARLFN